MGRAFPVVGEVAARSWVRALAKATGHRQHDPEWPGNGGGGADGRPPAWCSVQIHTAAGLPTRENRCLGRQTNGWVPADRGAEERRAGPE